MDDLIEKESGVLLRNGGGTITDANWMANPYIKAATSDNTRKAYRSDVRHFQGWGGRLPATTEIVVNYLQHFAGQLNPRTLARRLTAIRNWHVYQGFEDPTKSVLVEKTLRGIFRIHGQPRNKAPALTPDDLIKIVRHLSKEDSLANVRDSALLQLGFFGAFRRSELVAIQYENITWHDEGIEVLVSKSKTDQEHEGQSCFIPKGNEVLCTTRALECWLDESGIDGGPVFRRLFRSGKIDSAPLTPLSVNHIIKKHALRVGLDNAKELSSHSLRRGLATSTSQSGASMAAIMRQGRWKHVDTVVGYVEAGDSFSENAVNSLFK